MKKNVNVIVLSMLSVLILFVPTIYAKGNVEEKNIVIDVGHIESKPANLIADYDSDFNELVAQIMEQDQEYQLLESQIESDKSSSERKEEIKELQVDRLNRIELQAKKLLESRYEDNNTDLRPEILV